MMKLVDFKIQQKQRRQKYSPPNIERWPWLFEYSGWVQQPLQLSVDANASSQMQFIIVESWAASVALF